MAALSVATPESPAEEQPSIGLIGMGEMGRMYAKHLSQAGWKRQVTYSYNSLVQFLTLRYIGLTFVISRKSLMRYSESSKECPYERVLSHPDPFRLDVPGITVLKDGHMVSRASDWIMYAVEAEYIDKAVRMYGPCESFSLT